MTSVSFDLEAVFRVHYGRIRGIISHEPPDAPLPDVVATGAEPFLVVGAMAGGEPCTADPRRTSCRGGS